MFRSFGFKVFRSIAFYLALKTLKESGYVQVYKSVEKPLQLAQTAAVLEVALFQLNRKFLPKISNFCEA